MAADTTMGPMAPADDRIDPKKAVAFLAMVFGMFMAIRTSRSSPHRWPKSGRV